MSRIVLLQRQNFGLPFVLFGGKTRERKRTHKAPQGRHRGSRGVLLPLAITKASIPTMGEGKKAAGEAVRRSPGVVVGREFSSLSRLAQGVKFKNQLLQSITKRFQPAHTSPPPSLSSCFQSRPRAVLGRVFGCCLTTKKVNIFVNT